MTNLIACFTRRGARANLRVPSSRVIARRAKPDVAISSRHLRFRRGFLVFRACTARLHPKGTSSRCALRAPRPLRGLAMTRQGGAAVHQSPHAVKLPPTRRSLSAATDAIGLYGLSLPCTSRKCLPEIATSAVGLLAMTNLGASCCRIHAADAVSRARGNNEDLQRQGNAVSAFP